MNIADLKPLISILADGQFHSGEALGERLGITRAAVWKRLQCLAQLDLPIETVKSRGYRIPGGMSLLDAVGVQNAMSQESRKLLRQFHCFDEVASTNQLLLQEGGSGDVCVAERQTAGRGRRGRQWFSPFGSNLYLSVRWHFAQGVTALEGLSLAVGVALAEVLSALGIVGIELKWPNDLLCDGKKLGGILIEIGGDLTGDCAVVVGVGLNVSMQEHASAGATAAISQPWTDLRQQGYSGDRNLLCSALLTKILPLLRDYPEQGFAFYKERWETRAAFIKQSITVHLPGGVHAGILVGVDGQGGLRMLTEQGEMVFSGGEISLRGQA